MLIKCDGETAIRTVNVMSVKGVYKMPDNPKYEADALRISRNTNDTYNICFKSRGTINRDALIMMRDTIDTILGE